MPDYKNLYKLIEGLSGPFREEVDVLESKEEYPEDVKFKGIKQKPRSKPKRELEPEQIKKFEGRQKLTRREVVNYISKNIKKNELIDFIAKKGLYVRAEEGEHIGEMIKADKDSLADMSKEELIKIINSKSFDNKKRNFKKYELLQLAKLSEKGQRLIGAGHSDVIDRLLAKMKANYRPAPKEPSPMLSEQVKTAEKAGFPGNHYDESKGGKKITQGDIDRMQKGLKLYHKFARDYKELPDYGEVMDKKKALKHAYKVYKKLLEKSDGDHEVAMKDIKSFHKKILNKHGAGEMYSKTLAKLARKDVDLV
jgi:hypothetical protein